MKNVDFITAVDNAVRERKGLPAKSDNVKPLGRTADVPVSVPLPIDTKHWLRYAPNKVIPLHASPSFLQDAGANYQGNLRRNLLAVPRILSTTLFQIGQFATLIPDLLLDVVGDNNPYSSKQNLPNLSHLLTKAEKDVNDWIGPILHRTSYDQKTFGEQITSSEFVGEELAQGVAFFAGMMIPGAVLSKLGAFKVMSRAMRAGNYKTIEALRSTDFGRKLMKATKGTTARHAWQMTEATSDAMALHSFTAYQTMVEAGMESSFLQDELFVTLSEKVKNGEINPKTGKAWTKSDVEETLAQAGSSIYGYNLLVLGISNTIMNKMLFGNRKLQGRDFMRLTAAENAAELNRVQKGFKKIANFSRGAAKGILSEGFWEEGMQTAGEMKLKAEKLKNEDPSAFELLSETVDSYSKMLQTNEGAKAIFIGSLLGAGPSAAQRLGEQKQAKKVYDLISEHRNKVISKWLKPSLGEIYKRDADGKVVFDENGPVLNAEELVKSAEQKLALEIEASRIREMASKNPEAFENYIREVIIPQALKAYLRFDETLELFVDDATEIFEEYSKLNPDVEFQMSKDELIELARQMRQDVKDFQGIADMFGFVEETKEDLKSKDKDTKMKPMVFAWNEVMSVYLDAKNKVRHLEKRLANPKVTTQDKEKIEKALEIAKKEVQNLEEMSKSEYGKAYLKWKKGEETEAARRQKVVTEMTLESHPAFANMSEDDAQFFKDHYFVDTLPSPNNKDGQREFTSLFNIIDKDGNIIESDVQMSIPKKTGPTGSIKTSIIFEKNGNVYERVTTDTGVLISKNGEILEDAKIEESSSAEQEAAKMRVKVLNETLKQFSEIINEYIKNFNKGKTAIDNFETVTQSILSDIQKLLNESGTKSYAEVIEVFNKLQEFSESVEESRDVVKNTEQIIYETLLAHQVTYPDLMDVWNNLLQEKEDNNNGIPSDNDIKDFVNTNFTKHTNEQKLEAIANLTKLTNLLSKAYNVLDTFALEPNLKSLIKGVVHQIYFNAGTPYGNISDEEVEGLFLEISPDVIALVKRLDSVSFLESLQQYNYDDARAEDAELINSLTRSPLLNGISGQGINVLEGIIRPGINDELNSRRLKVLRKKANLTEDEQNELAYLENLESYFQMVLNEEVDEHIPLNSHLISASAILNGEVAKKFGQGVADYLKDRIFFYVGNNSEGKARFMTLSQIEKDQESEKLLNFAKKDRKLVFLGANSIVPNDSPMGPEHILVDNSDLSKPNAPLVIHTSILSINSISESENRPAFLFKIVGNEVQPRWSNLTEDDALIEQLTSVYQEVLDAIDEKPVSLNVSNETNGAWNNSKSYGWENIDNIDQTLADFIATDAQGANAAFPRRYHGKTAYQLLQEGIISHQGRVDKQQKKAGRLYLNLQKRSHPIIMSLLDEKTIDQVVDLLDWIANHPNEVQKAKEIMDYLSTVFNISSESAVLQEFKYSIAFTTDTHALNSGRFEQDVMYVDKNGVFQHFPIKKGFKESAHKDVLKAILREKRFNLLYQDRIEKLGYKTFKVENEAIVESSYGTYENYFNEMATRMKTVLQRLDSENRRYVFNPSLNLTPNVVLKQTPAVKPLGQTEELPKTTEDDIKDEELIPFDSNSDDYLTVIDDLEPLFDALDEGNNNAVVPIILKDYIFRDGKQARIDTATVVKLWTIANQDNVAFVEELRNVLSNFFKKPASADSVKPVDMNPFENILGVNVEMVTPENQKSVANKALKWFQEHHPSAVLRFTDGYISEEGAVGRLLEGGDILLSRLWSMDSLYHEAWHRVSLYFMTNKQRKAAYDEVRNRLGNKDLTDFEAEEYLADEFRKYMLHKDNYIFPDSSSEQKSLFDKIVDFFKQLVEWLLGVPSKQMTMEDLFYYAENGVFEDKINTTHVGVFNMIPGLSRVKTQNLIRHIGNSMGSYMWSEENLTNPNRSIVYAVQNNTSVDLSRMLESILLPTTSENLGISPDVRAYLLASFEVIKSYRINEKTKGDQELTSNEIATIEKSILDDIREELQVYLKRQKINLSVKDAKPEEVDEEIQKPLGEDETFFQSEAEKDSDDLESTQETEVEGFAPTEVNSWARANRDMFKSLPTLAKLFFFGVIYNESNIHNANVNEGVNVPSLEADINRLFKLFTEQMRGLNSNQMIPVLEKLARKNPTHFGPLVERMRVLQNLAQYDTTIQAGLNEIYRATQQSLQNFSVATETHIVNKTERSQYLANLREFNRVVQNGKYMRRAGGAFLNINSNIEGKESLLDAAIFINNNLRNPVAVLNKLEEIFGPILRYSVNESLSLSQRATVVELGQDFFDLIIKTIIFKNQLLNEKNDEINITYQQFIGIQEVRIFLNNISSLKTSQLARSADQSVDRLKGANSRTKQYGIGENTHLTNLLNKVYSISEIDSYSAKKATMANFLEAAGIAKVFYEKGEMIVEPHSHLKNNFIVQKLIEYYNNITDSSKILILDEYINQGFQLSQYGGESKALEIMSDAEILQSVIQHTIHGYMPMVPAGARSRESYIDMKQGAQNVRPFLQFFSDINTNDKNSSIKIELALADLFFDEIYRMIDYNRTLNVYGDKAPKVIKDFLAGNPYQSALFDDVLQLNNEEAREINSQIKFLVDRLSVSKISDNQIKNEVEGFRAQFKDKVVELISTQASLDAVSLLESMPNSSKGSQYETDLRNYLTYGEVPSWVIMTPLVNLLMDGNQELVFEKAFREGKQFAQPVIIDFSEVYETMPGFEKLKGYYVINPKTFGFSDENQMINNQSSKFMSYVAAKYNWPNGYYQVINEAIVAVPEIPQQDGSQFKDIQVNLAQYGGVGIQYYLTEEQAKQVAKEINLLTRLGMSTTQGFAVGSSASFGKLKNVMRRQESIGSNKNTPNYLSSIDRFDKAVYEPNKMKILVLDDIVQMPNIVGQSKERYEQYLEFMQNKINQTRDPKEKALYEKKLREFKKGMASGSFEGTDALSQVTLDFYKQLLYQNGTWPEELEILYVAQYQILFQKAIEYNKRSDNKLTFEGQIVDESIWNTHPLLKIHGQPNVIDGILIPQYKGEIANLKTDHVFKSLKPQGTGSKLSEGTKLPIFVQFKTAFTPLVPSEFNTDEDFLWLWDKTMVQHLDVVTHSSAVKDALMTNTVHSLNTLNFGLQIQEPLTQKAHAVLASQKSALNGLDLYNNTMFSQAEQSAFQVKENEFVDLMESLIYSNQVEFYRKLGVSVDFSYGDTGGRLKVYDRQLFVKQLQKMADNGNINQASLDQLLSLFYNDDSQKLDSKVAGQHFINVFLSSVSKYVNTIRHESIKMYVQEADNRNKLKFYGVDSNGNILPPQIKMPIPKSYEKWILKTFGDPTLSSKENYIYAYTRFKEVYENDVDGIIPDKMREAIINRTPMDNRHSATPVEIASYLLPWEGSKVVVPMELVYIYGFDFDFDKSTTYTAVPTVDNMGRISFRTQAKNATEFVNYLLEDVANNNFSQLNKVLSISKAFESLSELRNELEHQIKLVKDSSKIERVVRGKVKVISKADAIRQLKANIEVYSENKKLSIQDGDIESANRIQELIENSISQIERIEESLIDIPQSFDRALKKLIDGLSKQPQLFKNGSFDPSVLDRTDNILNSLFENERQTMLTPPAVFLSTLPVGVDRVTKITEESSQVKEVIANWSDLFKITKTAKVRSVILNTGNGIGIGASSISMFSRLQKSPLFFDNNLRLPIKNKNDKQVVVGQRFDYNGELTSLWKSEFINLSLDVTKNTTPFFAGINAFVMGPITFMLMTGTVSGNVSEGNMTPEMIIDTLNTPLVKEFIKAYYSNIKNNRFETRREATKDAVAQSLAKLGINPLVTANNKFDRATAEELQKAFANYSEKQRFNEARLALQDREKPLGKNKGQNAADTKIVTPLLFQAVQPIINNYKNKEKAKPMYDLAIQTSLISDENLKIAKSDATSFEWADANMRILDAFLTIVQYSEQATSLFVPMRRDGTMTDSISKLERYEETRNEFLSQKNPKLFTQESVRNFVDSNYLNKFVEIDNFAFDFLSSKIIFYSAFSSKQRKEFFNYFGREVTYEMIKEYFPTFVVAKYTDEFKEKAENLITGDPLNADSFLSSFKDFAKELERVTKTAYPDFDIEDHPIIKALLIEPNFRDSLFGHNSKMSRAALSNERISGIELNNLENWIYQVVNDIDSNGNPTELQKVARKFFDNLSIMSLMQNAHNRMYSISKALVVYDNYINMIDGAFNKFLLDINNPTFKKEVFLKEFAETIIVNNAKDFRFLPAKLDAINVNEIVIDEDGTITSQLEVYKDNFKDPFNDFKGTKYVGVIETVEVVPEDFFINLDTEKAFNKISKFIDVIFVYERNKVKEEYGTYIYNLVDVEGYGKDFYNPFGRRSPLLSRKMTLARALRYTQRVNERIDFGNQVRKINSDEISRIIANRNKSSKSLEFASKQQQVSNLTRSKIATKAALSTLFGSKVAEELIPKMGPFALNSFQLALDNANKILNDIEERERTSIIEDVIIPVVAALNKTGESTIKDSDKSEAWNQIRHLFNTESSKFAKKAQGILNDTKESSTIKIGNQQELEKVQFDPSNIKQPEDAYLFAKTDTDAIVNAFYNFDKVFPKNEWMTKRDKLALIRMVSSNTIDIVC